MRGRTHPERFPPRPGPSPECAPSTDQTLRPSRTPDASPPPPLEESRDVHDRHAAPFQPHRRSAAPVPTCDPSVLRNETSLIGFSRTGGPALREVPHALLGPWIPRPSSNASRGAEALRGDRGHAEAGKEF